MSFTGEFVEVETSDGLELQGLKSEGDGAEALIVHIHGMQGNFFQNGFAQRMLEKYPEDGYSFLSVELRGAEAVRFFPKGERVLKAGNAFEELSDSVKDIRAWLDYAEDLEYENLVLQGHSLGTVKAVNFLAKRDHSIDAAVLMSPPDMHGIFSRDDQYAELRQEAEMAVENGQGEKIITEDLNGWAYLSAETFLDLCTQGADADLFSFTQDRKLDRWSRIRMPALVTYGSNDTAVVGDSEAAARQLEEEFQGGTFDFEIFKGCQHDYSGYEDELIEKILTFLESTL